MMKPVQISLKQTDGNKRDIIIVPIIGKGGERGLRATGVYKIYDNASGDNTHLLTETVYLDDLIDKQADGPDPGQLGEFLFADNSWEYRGRLFTSDEQNQITGVISSYNDSDI